MSETPAPDGYRARLLIAQYERWKRRGSVLIIVALLVFIGLVIVGVALQPPTTLDTSKLGVHVLLDDGRNRWEPSVWASHLDAAQQIVGTKGWVVQVIRADDLDVARWQTFLDLCEQRHLTPILRLASTFNREMGLWNAPPADADGRYHALAQRYVDFVKGLTWHSQPIIILLNEPNNGHEWGGQPNASAYAHFVMDTASAFKKAVPESLILNGALDLYAPNTGSKALDGVYYQDANTFLDAMVTAEPTVLAQFSVWNNHSYPIGFAQAPNVQAYQFDFINDAQDTTQIPPQGVFNRGINGYTWELWKLSTLGVTHLRVMITETGWKHSDSLNADTLDTGDYPNATLQAQYWDIALRGNDGRYPDLPTTGWTPLLSDPRVIAVIPFALDGIPEEWGHTNWLQLGADGQVLGTYPVFDSQKSLVK